MLQNWWLSIGLISTMLVVAFSVPAQAATSATWGQVKEQQVTELEGQDEDLLQPARKAVGHTGNVDPRYNISCDPGQAVIYMDGEGGGIYFLCQTDAITRAYELHNLKQDAVVDEVAGLGLLAEIAWILNLYLDDTLRIERYKRKVVENEREAEDYRDRANNTSSKARRDRYLRKAERCEEKAEEYRDKIDRLLDELNSQAPDGVEIGVNWTY